MKEFQDFTLREKKVAIQIVEIYSDFLDEVWGGKPSRCPPTAVTARKVFLDRLKSSELHAYWDEHTGEETDSEIHLAIETLDLIERRCSDPKLTYPDVCQELYELALEVAGGADLEKLRV